MKKFLYNLGLRLGSLPVFDMAKDYQWVRNLQEFLAGDDDDGFAKFEVKASTADHSIPVRLFLPINWKESGRKQAGDSAAIVFIHGGGWTLGNVNTYAETTQKLADEFGLPVYSINYRLAPEYPYPAGFNDVYDAVSYLCQNRFRGQAWFLMGDSSGGNLAAALSLRLRDEGKDPANGQILFYPVTNADHDESVGFESVQTKGEGYGLTNKKLQEFMANYVPDPADRYQPYVAPLLAEDLSGQPDTLIIVAENDPLRDEGIAYVVRLCQAGNQAEVHVIEEASHGFLTLREATPFARQSFDYMHRFIDREMVPDD